MRRIKRAKERKREFIMNRRSKEEKGKEGETRIKEVREWERRREEY